MKIYYSFLIILCSVLLILLPVNQGVYNFKNAQRTDTFTITTGATPNATVQLFKVLTDNDTNTIEFLSYDVNDAPLFSSYNGTTRALNITGLAQNTTRSLEVGYDTPVITNASMVLFLNIIPWIWVLVWVMFPVMAMVVMWKKH